MSTTKKQILTLPALRGVIGSWVYYSCLVNLEEIAKRVQFADEILKSKQLSGMIQRKLQSTRSAQIARYIRTQPERIAEIKAEYEIRRARLRRSIPINPLRPVRECPDDIDDIYGEDEGGGACVVCHK